MLSGLLSLLSTHKEYQDLLTRLHDHAGNGFAPLGVIRSARPFVIAALARDLGRPLVVLQSRIKEANDLAEQLLAWAPDLNVLTYAEPDAVFYERAPWGVSAVRGRLKVIAEAMAGFQPGTVIVTSAGALMQRTLPRDLMAAHTIELKRGDHIQGGSSGELLRRLLGMGYQPSSVVTEPGSFSHRGGIIDIFPVSSAFPVRVELWGDAIESLRAFEPASQRSLHLLDSILVTPAREALPALGPVAAAALSLWFDSHQGPAPDDEESDIPLDPSEQELLEQGATFPALEFYLPWMLEETASLLEYLPDDALIIHADEKEEFFDTIIGLEENALALRAEMIEKAELPSDTPLAFVSYSHLIDELSLVQAIALGGSGMGESSLGDLFSPGPRFAGQLRLFLDKLVEETRGERERAIVISRQAPRLHALWREMGRPVQGAPVEVLEELPPAGPPIFIQGALAEGWVFESSARPVTIYTDAEIFGWKRPEPRRRVQQRPVAPEDFFTDLEPGQYVVHIEFGVGQFAGLSKRTVAGVDREFLLIEYAGGDKLFVPIHQADRLSRYVGVDDEAPSLSRLGTQEWERTRARAQQAAQEVAEDLIELYAVRESAVGYAFSPDTHWQAELEASFPFIETEDQLRSLAEIKADMESTRPMDRLVCGDVGYGKTEVALRAAFKAVMDGKQVAVLVPTTVLAQQHYETFRARLVAFPVTVSMLSRFRTRAEQNETIARTAEGRVDILIGTHRLLAKDIQFKDLGLLIIDEEQRFGVAHKEALKKMRAEVDVLTLTATPIPRTLYMSLTGVRDISIISTAPSERLPVITHVGKRDDDLIRQAVLREMDRGGQVFFVHNRVQTILTEKARLEKIVPEARIGIAHGQMHERQLEKVMTAFGEGQIDLLVSTNIIEAGLDIPNANTLIVDRADRFGLAQLYQLRGRVGRSAARAFAYFFHPAYSRLTPEARARLETIDEYSDLGAGMQIAMRDLEIRGSGDILGLRQSGHIALVGFHLYMQMLSQAVRRLKAERSGEIAPPGAALADDSAALPAVTIDVPLPTYLPTEYISDLGLRIQLYRRMGDLRTEGAIDDFGDEIADRFGPPPSPVENLLYQLKVKLRAIRAGVDAVVSEGDQMAIKLTGLEFLDRWALQREIGYKCRVSRTAVFLPRLGDWQAALLDVLDKLNGRGVFLLEQYASADGGK